MHNCKHVYARPAGSETVSRRCQYSSVQQSLLVAIRARPFLTQSQPWYSGGSKACSEFAGSRAVEQKLPPQCRPYRPGRIGPLVPRMYGPVGRRAPADASCLQASGLLVSLSIVEQGSVRGREVDMPHSRLPLTQILFSCVSVCIHFRFWYLSDSPPPSPTHSLRSL
jgi:hypothetical protein